MVPIELAGKVALVTGSARGIGRAAALELARAGADLVVTWASNEAAGRAVAAEIEALGRAALHLHEEAREAGWEDEQLLEALAHVALARFANLMR
ncbi:MAG TPA: SDR family NAD(P)-dependent oxidoreductase [Geminicoccaceae bacterium]|nr:SDR family NAD(P)-dependent oxidoreductase [Geminicoccaceae bacterium]